MARAPRFLQALAVVLLALSCGKKGPVLAPLRPDPQPVADLKVGQQGDTLVVSYQAPRQTLDLQPLDVHEIEVLVADKPGDITKVGRVVHRVQVAPGETRTEAVPLPAVGSTVRTAVRGRFKGIRGAPSRVVGLTVETPPPAPASVTASNDPAGVLVMWPTVPPTPAPTARLTPSPTATPTPMPAATTAAGATAVAAAPTPTPTPAPTAAVAGYLVRRRPPTGAATLLTAKPIPAPPFLDESSLATGRWCYSVARVVAWEPLVASTHSPEGCVDVKDVRPPQPPSGLTLIASRGALELSWSPSADPDVATYRVYRSHGGGEPQRLGEQPPADRLFRDTAAVRGTVYQYQVTAVDGSGNESALSAPVEASLR
jgi:hypothetical protein